jgi:hypothetical protein
MPVAFDTLAYARRLKGAGFTEEQAEVQAEALAAVVLETVATKQDLRELAMATKQDLRELATVTKQDLRELAMATKQDLRELEYRLTLRLGAMITVAVGAVAALTKVL